jgi:Reverse transcriptase (RNA-dependent DNA polymerase)
MKIITNRRKHTLASLISNTQGAFLKGRSIQKNVLLMKEVLHSFQSLEYHERAFALKADLLKAFDTLSWDFLERVLHVFGFPIALINLILSCVTGSRLQSN